MDPAWSRSLGYRGSHVSWVYGVTGELRMHKLSTQIPSSPSGTPHMDFHHQHFGKYPRGVMYSFIKQREASFFSLDQPLILEKCVKATQLTGVCRCGWAEHMQSHSSIEQSHWICRLDLRFLKVFRKTEIFKLLIQRERNSKNLFPFLPKITAF